MPPPTNAMTVIVSAVRALVANRLHAREGSGLGRRQQWVQQRVQGRPPAFGADFQAPFLQEWLRWSGIEEAGTVTFPTEPGDLRRRSPPSDCGGGEGG
jgi:hypothetical protein